MRQFGTPRRAIVENMLEHPDGETDRRTRMDQVPMDDRSDWRSGAVRRIHLVLGLGSRAGGYDMILEGKSAIVTGGGSGFGAGIARRFAEQGAQVAIADINVEKAAAVARESGTQAFEVDVSDSGSVGEFARAFCREFGAPDILVNNAGITHDPAPLEDISEDEFLSVFRVNCMSVYLTARYFVPHMKKTGGGCILNIASTAGLSPRPRLNWYNASKGWMITATRTMAIELAPDRIRVNALAPVAGETPLLKRFLGEDTPETRAAFLATIPLGRFSVPDDLANAASFLCSDDAGMVTGAVLPVDGGRTI